MQIKYVLMACHDCLMLVANDEEPDDKSNCWRAIYRFFGAKNVRNLCLGDSEHDDEFSWQRCECCDSPLGGSRHELIVLE